MTQVRDDDPVGLDGPPFLGKRRDRTQRTGIASDFLDKTETAIDEAPSSTLARFKGPDKLLPAGKTRLLQGLRQETRG